MPNDLALVFVNWQSGQGIIDTIKSIAGIKQDSIIVADNNPNDKSLAKIKKIFPGINTVRIMENRGYAGGANAGIRKAIQMGCSLIYLLNSDIKMDIDSIMNMRKFMESRKDPVISGPLVLNKKGKIWSYGGEVDRIRFTGHLNKYGDRFNIDLKTIEADYIPGTAMIIPAKVFEKVGYFDERFFMYYEDTDFCFRARKAGVKCLVNPDSTIIHYGSLSLGKGSRKHEYYLARNHLLFLSKNAPFSVKFRENLRLPLTLMKHVLNKNTGALIGLKDYFLGKFGNYDNWN